jgi:leucyl-tRNA synthetase
VFKDMGLINHREPVKKLVYHGYVNAEDGRKMSKSLGNVIDPLDIIDQGYGADTLRTYVLFMGPIELDSAWSSQGVGGVHRFLNRVWTLIQEYLAAEVAPNDDIAASLEQIRHRTIKKVTNDYRELSFNTATAALMEYVNELYKAKTTGFTTAWRLQLETLVQLLSPLAPHVSAELWEQLGNDQPLDTAMWPHWDDSQIKTDTITLAVQVNGKLRATLELPAGVTKEAAIEAALASENVARHVAETGPKKTIYVPGRLINIVS